MEPAAVIITLVVLAAIAVGVYLFLRNRKAQNEETETTEGYEGDETYAAETETVLPEVPAEERPETVEVVNPTTIGTAEVEVVGSPAPTRVFNGATAYKPAAPAEAVTSPASTAAVFGTAVVVDGSIDGKNIDTNSSDTTQVNTTDTAFVSSTDSGSTTTN